MPPSSCFNHWRLELFFKSQSALQSNIPFLSENGLHRLNLTNKAKDDKLLESLAKIKAALPRADVCIHYSIKWNYKGGVDGSFEQLSSFCKDLATVEGPTSILLVSGGGKKRKFDTIEALKMLSRMGSDKPTVPIHMAFNPYLPDSKDAAEERERLKEKLLTNMVAGVWLQTGSDLQKLKNGLSYVKALSESCDRRPELYGSVFLPSKRLLAQMKYRPWNGVFLSDEYLDSVEGATRITRELLKLYAEQGIIPLVESNVTSSQDLRRLLELLGIA